MLGGFRSMVASRSWATGRPLPIGCASTGGRSFCARRASWIDDRPAVWPDVFCTALSCPLVRATSAAAASKVSPTPLVQAARRLFGIESPPSAGRRLAGVRREGRFRQGAAGKPAHRSIGESRSPDVSPEIQLRRTRARLSRDWRRRRGSLRVQPARPLIMPTSPLTVKANRQPTRQRGKAVLASFCEFHQWAKTSIEDPDNSMVGSACRNSLPSFEWPILASNRARP